MAGVNNIGIIVGDRHDEFKQISYKENFETKITFIIQRFPLGLAHAVETARSFIKNNDFIVALGDNIFTQKLRPAVELFYRHRADALIFLAPVKEPQRYGIAYLEDGVVKHLEEKPPFPRSNLAIMGLYIFKETIFPAIAKTRPSRRGELEITDALQELIKMGGKVIPYHYEGWWLDVGRPEDLLLANHKILELQSKSCFFKIAPSAHILNSILRGPITIGDRCLITNAVVGPYTSVGEGTKIKNACIEESVLLKNVRIKGIKRPIKNSIIGTDTMLLLSKRDNEGCCKFLLGNKSRVELDR